MSLSHESAPSPYHHDKPTPLPSYEGISPNLIEVVHLSKALAPEGSRRFVKSSVHVIQYRNGETGYQVVNEMADGVSLLSIDVVRTNGRTKGYAVMVDQIRYPHPRMGYGDLSIEQAARQGVLGRWSREIISGGVEASDKEAGSHAKEDVLHQAIIREAREEAGIHELSPDDIVRIMPTVYSSISVNRQAFNLFATELKDGMWRPTELEADIEEGKIHVAAYDLRDAVPEMINNSTIIEMSSITAINGLYRHRQFRKYLD